MSENSDIRISEADIAAHAAQMVEQAWWPLFEAEQALAPCPICGGRQLLRIDGTGACEAGCP
ncbi:hypothetical protein [Nocardioides sp. T2.26MG-1]|uniref:hypothetical protein n=1 Tax=Nocardioides sp. T2.26MG-1 TaxID=3041166 RepID=UPI0024774167|nr:hypothetical protein [Nocardioides sp. T2.26MG-1]CAI9408353.1 hypothetical protein HIDPHFAB_01061 [Nocardioides sp. T2.26MG-1]